jgi:hypothetical protein
MGQVNGFEDLMGYRTPGIGPDRAREPKPIREGAPFNCREDAFEGPGLYQVIRRRINIAEPQSGGHSTISTASQR